MNTELALLPSPAGNLVSRSLTASERETIGFHQANSLSANTKLAYESQWKNFCDWAAANRLIAYPVSVETVILYLDYMARTEATGGKELKFSSIEQALASIKAVHSFNLPQHPEFAMAVASLTTRNQEIQRTLNSIKRLLVERGAMQVAKPRHFSQQEVISMSNGCPDTLQGLQDRAILLLGCNAGLRASEICSLIPTDLVKDAQGLDVTIRNSKTDQFGNTETVFVQRLSPIHSALDAVKAMQEFQEATAHLRTEDADLPVFLGFRRGGKTLHLTKDLPHGITREAITDTVVRCFIRASLVQGTQSVSSHSLRHTFVTQGFQQRISGSDIALTSRHRSMGVLMGYNQQSRRDSSVSTRLWS